MLIVSLTFDPEGHGTQPDALWGETSHDFGFVILRVCVSVCVS